MGAIFSTFIYQPILNVTVLLYATVGFNDLGVAIVVMTLIIRLALAPLSIKAARSQRELAKLSPKLDELKEKHKGDTNAQSAAVMQLYKDHSVNPLAGCLPMLVQLPVLIGMYRVFLNIFKPENLQLLYSFIPHPIAINHLSFGVLDVSVPSHLLALGAGVAQFFQAKIAASGQPQSSQVAALNKQMLYLFPVMIVVISWNFPAGLALYWITTTLFSVGEQLYLRRQ